MLHKKSQVLFKKITKNKGEVLKLQQKQKKLIKIFFTDKKLIEGCYRTTLIKCGKKGCRCEKKPIHLVTRLSKWEDKKLKNQIVRVGDRKWVQEYSENYKRHKTTIANYEKISKRIKEILKKIIKMKAVKYE